VQKSAKLALIACVVVVIGGSAAFWWFALRDTAPDKASLSAIGNGSSSSSTAPVGTNGGGTGGGSSSATSADGSWTVAPGSDVFVGYRIDEVFGGESVTKTAAGRTPAVTGTMVVQGSTIPSATITADVTKLASDRAQRDNAIKTRALQTDSFPEATFTLTQPIALPSVPKLDEQVSVTATGDLTLHGVTRSVQMPLQAQWKGDSIAVAGGTTITLADYGIDKIATGFVTVADSGEIEVQLNFTRA
jgi:polyisoprenoid-binding protein YceI